MNIKKNSYERKHLYTNEPRYKSFIEIVNKSEITINKGNDYAHKFEIDKYEDKAKEFILNNNLNIANMNKIYFLFEIGVSKDLFIDGYNFLDKFFNDDISRAILRSQSFGNFFLNKISNYNYFFHLFLFLF